MTYSEAIQLAILILGDQVTRLTAVRDVYQTNDLPAAVIVSNKRTQILEAISALQDGILGGMPPFVAGDWSGYEVCTICGGLVRYDLRESHFMECQAAFLADEIPATPA